MTGVAVVLGIVGLIILIAVTPVIVLSDKAFIFKISTPHSKIFTGILSNSNIINIKEKK